MLLRHQLYDDLHVIMRTNVTETSRQAFAELQRDRMLQPMQQRILDVLAGGARMTRKQLRDATGMELSSVCGRVNSLLAAGLIETFGETVDPKTRKSQELLGLAREQLNLFTSEKI